MNLPWKRTRRRRGFFAAAVALGALVLALPLLPSVRRYARMESM